MIRGLNEFAFDNYIGPLNSIRTYNEIELHFTEMNLLRSEKDS